MKRSDWFGLWNNNENSYMISQPIKIDKAIDYIKKHSTDENGDIGINLFSYDCVELLEILERGETNESN